MAKVGIVMGSDSDMPVMAKAADILDQLGISYEMRIISAHREPDEFFEYAKTAEEKGFKYLPVSAKDGVNIISMFEIMGDDCLKAILKEESNNENELKEDIKKGQRSLNEVNDKQIKKPEKKVVNLSKKKLNKNKEKRCC